MNRGYGYLPKGKPRSPPRRGRADLQGSSRMASNRSQAARKQDLNIDDFGDMGSDEDDFQTLAANFVPPKPPAQPQYNLVPYGLLRDDDELADEDYDGVPISESSTSSPKPESPVPSPWKSSPRKEEIKGDPITVLGSGNRPNPMIQKWTSDVRSQDRAQPNRFQGLGSSMGALGCNKIGSLGTPNPQPGKGRWDSKINPNKAIQPGSTRSNIPPLMGIELGKGQTFVRAQDESNPLMNKSQTTSGNAQNFVCTKDDRNSFLQTSLGQTSTGSSANSFVRARARGNTFPHTSDRQGTSKSSFPATNIPSTQSYDKPNDPTKTVKSITPAWAGRIRESPLSVKEHVSSVPNQIPSQIEMLQAAALQQAFTGITQLDPKTGLSLLMQASQNPTLAAALLNTISNAGLAGSRMTPSSNHAIEALLKSAGTAPTPAAPQTQPNLGAPHKMTTPDGSGATRYPAPDLSSLVFDPSTGYRFDDSTGLHYDANSGYFFNSKLKIYLRWDKFTQTYLRVENPPGVPRFINLPTDPSAYQGGSSLASQGVVESSRSMQNPPFSKEIIQSSKVFPSGSFNQEIGTFKNVLEPRNTVQPSTPPSYNYSGGSHSFVDSRSGEPNTPTAVDRKLASLPNLAETSLFNKLRKAKLAAQAKPDRRRWGEPDPLLEAVQKHTNETSQSQTGVLNLEEILQRSRQFMKGTGGDLLTLIDGRKDRLTRTNRSPGPSGDKRRIRSPSRSPGRQRRCSQSLEKLGNRRISSISPQSSRGLSRGRSPDTRQGRPHSKGRSPINHDRAKRSSSPLLRRRPSPSRERNPNNRARGRPMSPEARKLRSDSRGRSPIVRSRKKQSLSPEARQKKSASRGRIPNNMARGRPMSPEARKRRSDSRGKSYNVQARRRQSLSPEARRKKSASRGRSPINRARGIPLSPEARKRRSDSRGKNSNVQARRRQSLSPEARRKKSASRGRSPNNRARGGPSLSPEARKRGRSPVRRRGKSSKSPDSKYRRTSNVRSSDRKLPVRLSKSPEHRRHHSQTPDRTSLNRSPPPVVKVVLNQSPGGSKVGLRDDKRAANLLSADSRTVLRKLNSNDVGNADNASDSSPGRRNLKSGGPGTVHQKSLTQRFGLKDTHDRGNARPNQEKEEVSELKPIPYDTPQGSGKKSAKAGKDVSGYKSLSNLRNQARDKQREKETDMKRDTKTRQTKDKSSERQPPKANLTTEEDDERRSRNHRLVSERTFSNSWKMKKPEPVSQVLSSTKSEYANRESNLRAENSIDAVGKKDDADPGVSDELEESNDFDFLNDTLDDDKESTIIDEYEEILDYQDLDSNSEPKFDNSTSIETDLKPHDLGAKKSLSKESIESPVIDLNLDPSEQSIETSTSVDSAQVSFQCSSVDGTELVDDPTTKLGDQATVPQDQGDPEDSETVTDKKIMHDVKDVVGSDGAKEMKSPRDNLDKAAQPTGTVNLRGESCSKDNGSVNLNELSKTLDAGPASMKINEESKETINDEDCEIFMKLAEQCSNASSGNKTFDNEDWNVVDSVDDQEEALTISDLAADEKTLAIVEASPSKEVSNNQAMDLGEAKASSEPKTRIEKKDSESGADVKTNTSNIGQGEETGLLTGEGMINQPQVEPTKGKSVDDKINKPDGKNDEPTAVSEISGNDEKVQGSSVTKQSEEINLQDDKEEPLLQVRSVSDIEKFLLLSSQEVEAKRDQGIDTNASKKEKKSDIFSRLGDKLAVEEESGSTEVSELQTETSIEPEKPSNLPSTSALPDKAKKLKPPTASGAAKKAKPEDPCKSLFVDEPTSTVLLGPMNFIEPIVTFQQFTQKYMQIALNQENIRYKKIYVHHEDGTGAPYHYILITFPFAHVATDWVNKHKGIYQVDPKIFKRTAGHTKHKLVPDAVAYLHFTEPNWICAVCKKSNFPPRSLCFGCFQNRDPDGFSPLILLDKGRPPFKNSTWVGTPKLKFFATKEKVIESVPPLDGFDIQRIEMIMDKEMGLPAGICVFELPTIVEAGKLKKYLNRRDVECVAVEMHEQFFETVESDPPIALSEKTPQSESQEDPPVSGDDLARPLSEDRGGLKRLRDVPEIRACSPRSRDIRVTKLSPSTSHDGLSNCIQSRSPSRCSPRSDYRPSSIGYQSPIRHVSRLEEESYTSPEARSVRAIISRDRSVRAISPKPVIEPIRYRSTERAHHSPVLRRYPEYLTPRYRSPVRDSLNRRSPPPRSRSPLTRRRSPVPRRLSPSPRRRPPSPRRRSPSPWLRSLSPRCRSPPAKRLTLSPRRRSPLPRRHSPSPTHVSPPPGYHFPFPAVRPNKPDGRSDWIYPPPDPKLFRFEPRSGLDYDPTTTLYYEPKSCCFYNDDSNEWLEYEPRTGCYRVVR